MTEEGDNRDKIYCTFVDLCGFDPIFEIVCNKELKNKVFVFKLLGCTMIYL